MKLSRLLQLGARNARDAEAVRSGRVGQRVYNRLLGKAVGRTTRRWWR